MLEKTHLPAEARHRIKKNVASICRTNALRRSLLLRLGYQEEQSRDVHRGAGVERAYIDLGFADALEIALLLNAENPPTKANRSRRRQALLKCGPTPPEELGPACGGDRGRARRTSGYGG
jgi:hypothetical protein